MSENRRPIVITGCPRSGTTWVGSTVAATPEVMYVYEPFNQDAHHHFRLEQRYLHLTSSNAGPYYRRIRALLSLGDLRERSIATLRALSPLHLMHDDLAATLATRELFKRPRKFARARRVCVKDPIAFFAAEWLSDTFDAQVVVIMRRPAGVISSYLKLGWGADVESVLAQEELCATYAGPLSGEIEAYRRGELDHVDALILQWQIFALAALALRQRHPEWLFITHEELCSDPVSGFRRIYDSLGLRWDETLRKKVLADTSARNEVDPARHRQHALKRESRALASAWKQRLDATTIARIEHKTERLWERIAASTGPSQQELRVAQ